MTTISAEFRLCARGPECQITTQPKNNETLDLAKEYISISYDPRPQRASADAVKHLCAPGDRFIAPSTFPNVHTLEEYAEDHGELMKQLNDLQHRTKGPQGPVDRECAVKAADGKLTEFIKDWNKLSMWQLGWPREECLTQQNDRSKPHVRFDRKITNAASRCVENCVCYRARGATDSEFSQPLAPAGFTSGSDSGTSKTSRRDIRIHRHQVFR